jgi:hypothetical protein
MGKGKGNVEYFVAPIKKGNSLYEMQRNTHLLKISDTENMYPKFLKKLRKEKEFRKGSFFVRLRRSRKYEKLDLQMNRFLFLTRKIHKIVYET